MDNKKIGKLIATLRKQKGLTQQDLGDKVGVGFRAVSKWERGLTLPDIGIINELSKILGITSDELLTGKLNERNKQKKKLSPTTIKISVSIITILIIIFAVILYSSNRTYAYSMVSANDEYYITGETFFKGNNICIVINKIEFKDLTFSSTTIKDYEYQIKYGNEYVLGFGHIDAINLLEKNISIKGLMETFNINYTGKTNRKRKEIIKNNIAIKFTFLDEFDKKIEKEIDMKFLEIG